MVDIDNMDSKKQSAAAPALAGIDPGKYVRRIRSHWKTIAVWTVVGFAVGCAVALMTPRRYEVAVKLAPELSVTATNRLSSLASLVGMSSTMLGTTDAVYPMVYPDILRSPAFLVDLFDVTVMHKENGYPVETTLYDYLTSSRKPSLLSLPSKAFSAVMNVFSRKEEPVVAANDTVDSFCLTREQGAIVNLLSHCISSEVDKKTMSLTIKVTMNDALVCASLAKAVDEQLWAYVTAYRTGKAQRDCEYYETLYEEAREDYYEALTAYSEYLDTHQDISFRSQLIESQKLKNESDLKYQLYNSMAQQLQMAKAKVQQETPVFAELIPPSVPLKSANSRKSTAITFAFVGLLAGTVWVLLRKKN